MNKIVSYPEQEEVLNLVNNSNRLVENSGGDFSVFFEDLIHFIESFEKSPIKDDVEVLADIKSSFEIVQDNLTTLKQNTNDENVSRMSEIVDNAMDEMTSILRKKKIENKMEKFGKVVSDVKKWVHNKFQQNSEENPEQNKTQTQQDVFQSKEEENRKSNVDKVPEKEKNKAMKEEKGESGKQPSKFSKGLESLKSKGKTEEIKGKFSKGLESLKNNKSNAGILNVLKRRKTRVA